MHPNFRIMSLDKRTQYMGWSKHPKYGFTTLATHSSRLDSELVNPTPLASWTLIPWRPFYFYCMSMTLWCAIIIRLLFTLSSTSLHRSLPWNTLATIIFSYILLLSFPNLGCSYHNLTLLSWCKISSIWPTWNQSWHRSPPSNISLHMIVNSSWSQYSTNIWLVLFSMSP